MSVLHIQSNTTNGDTTFTDLSNSNHTVLAFDNVQHSTTNPYLGSSSIAFDGSGDYLLVGDTSTFKFLHDGTTDYTVECWVNFSALKSTTNPIIGTAGNSTTTGFTIYYAGSNNNNNEWRVVILNASGSSVGSVYIPMTPQINTWYHVAAVHKDNTLYFYIDGELGGSSASANYSTEDSFKELRIGSIYNSSGSLYSDCRMQDIRISKTAVYTTEFTPPTSLLTSVFTTPISESINMEMIWAPAGTFTMGGYYYTNVEYPNKDGAVSHPAHEVTLTKGFYLGKYEVTQAQYEAVMTGNTDGLSATPSSFANNPNRPVEMVSWNDIQVFLSRLNQQQADNLPAGWAYVLPTEAQWEYACRAGTTTEFSFGDASSVGPTKANYGSNMGGTTDVGSYPSNPWGFFDMHGNVRELTANWYELYDSVPVTDPEGPTTGTYRVARGGGWQSGDRYIRSYYRSNWLPDTRHNTMGFRVALAEQPIDSIAPVITLTGDATIQIEVGSTYTELGATWTDNVDGTGNALVGGDTVDTSTVGTHTVTYNYTDASGNAATEVTRTVNVVAPNFIYIPSTSTFQSSVEIILPTPPNALLHADGTWSNSLRIQALAVFNGTQPLGLLSFDGSNIDSIEKLSTAKYKITFSTPMSSSNYVVSGSCDQSNASGTCLGVKDVTNSSFTLELSHSSNTPYDSDRISFQVAL